MPTYEYLCRVCGNRIEVVHGMTESGPTACERCGGPMRRVLQATGIIFKGSGFYKTDSRASSSSTAPTSSSATGSSAPGGTPPPPASPGDSGKAASTDKPSGTSDSTPATKPPDAS